jgi:biopolymer transport protein ExbD
MYKSIKPYLILFAGVFALSTSAIWVKLAQAPSAVIRTLEAPGRKDVTVLLLDEGRYCSDSPSELEALTRAYPGHELNLIVDVSISYGTVMTWIERLKACGVERINLVTVANAASDYPGSETH